MIRFAIRKAKPSWACCVFTKQSMRGAFIILLFFAAASSQGFALDNGLASTPPMGWNSWNAFQLAINEGKIRAAADFIATSGMKDDGYQYIVVDAGWKSKARDAQGRLVADPAKFPSGIKALADYIHDRGLKFGLYTDAGSEDCDSGAPGSRGHEELDARTFAEWGVDYLKEDWCHTEGLDARTAYETMSRAIQATGRPIVFSLCEWGDNEPWLWAAKVGNLWRTTGDGRDCWDCGGETASKKGGYPRGWTRILDAQIGLEQYAGPGHWNDPDLLLVGLPGLTVEEARAHFSLWAILAAPLMASCDLTAMPPAIADILKNEEAIAVDQDALGQQGTRVSARGAHEIWVRKLKDGGVAAVLFNRGKTSVVMRISAQDIGLGHSSTAQVRDVWRHENRGQLGAGYSTHVPAHGAVMLRINGSGM
jgi:alpha-galactosidase